jgi:ribosomal protein L11 methyltransferase
MNNKVEWWRIECSAPDAEEFASFAMIEGAQGIEIISPTNFYVYADKNPTALIGILAGYGITAHEPINIPPVNYVQKCEDIWQPITVGEIKLKPILDSDGPSPSSEPGTIWIIPGNGFGTGHHESTRLAIGLMLEAPVLKAVPKKILDLGTGNGILGLASALKFDCVVDAIDTDPLAIDNAEQNCKLNSVIGSKLRLITGDISLATGNYDLIFANIYASTLIQLESEIKRNLKPGGQAILAGIMAHEGADIESSFKKGWSVLKKSSEGNWCSFLLQKI